MALSGFRLAFGVFEGLDCCIIDERIEAFLLRQEMLRGGAHVSQVRQVQMQEFKGSSRPRPSFPNGGDGVVRFGLGACSDVDFGILRVQKLTCFLANTGIGARDNINLRGSHVILG